MHDIQHDPSTADLDTAMPSTATSDLGNAREGILERLSELAEVPPSEATTREIESLSSRLADIEIHGAKILATFQALSMLDSAKSAGELAEGLEALKGAPVTHSAILALKGVLQSSTIEGKFTKSVTEPCIELLSGTGAAAAAQVLIDGFQNAELSETCRMNCGAALAEFPTREVREKLLEFAKNNFDLLRRGAIRGLAGHDHPSVAEYLLERTEGSDTLTEIDVIDALGGQSDPRALEFLLSHLDHTNEGNSDFVRRCAAHALRKQSSAQARNALVKALKDPDPYNIEDEGMSVSEFAAESLQSFMNEETIALVLDSMTEADFFSCQREPFNFFLHSVPIKLAETSFPEFLRSDATWEPKSMILRSIDPEAIDGFRSCLHGLTKTPALFGPVRREALKLLRSAASPLDRDHMLRALGDSDPECTQTAVHYFEKLTNDGGFTLLPSEREAIERLQEHDMVAWRRKQIARILGE